MSLKVGPGPPDRAQLYEWECRHVLHRGEQDVAFWRDVALEGRGPVLELACGTGRLTLPLAGAGIPIVGLDSDMTMLATARQRRREAPWPLFVASDMRRFALAARFSLVFIGYNSLQLLTGPGDMAACLVTARKHLAPGGLIGIEVTDFQAGGGDDDEDDDEPLGQADGIRLSGSLIHDLAGRTSRYRRHFTGDGWTIDDEVVMRSIDRHELEAILAEAGLSATALWEHRPTIRALARPRP